MLKNRLIITLLGILLALNCLGQAPIISYDIPNTFVVDKPIPTLTPQYKGVAPTSYTINPSLPDGLSFSTSTGEISGKPGKPAAEAEYTVIATNKTGNSAPFKLKIKVDSALSKLPKLCPPQNTDTNFSIIGIFIFCFIIIAFVVVAGLRTQKNVKEALGFPGGSIRAIIALLFVVFFVLLAAVFYFDSNITNTHSSDLAKQILTILGTLVTAVSAFYFGSKATEQGHQIATDAFQKNSGQVVPDVPLNIVQSAINANKATWIDLYGAKDIAAGKKISQGNVQDLNAIIFTVASKDVPDGKQAIPGTINYISAGKSYDIPTDVQMQTIDKKNDAFDQDASDSFGQLTEAEQVSKMHSAIKLYWDKWQHTIDNITGVGIANKMIDKDNNRTGKKVIQFHVSQKIQNIPDNFTKVPDFVEYGGFKIPTDVIENDVIKPGANNYKYPGDTDTPRLCGASISRNDQGNDATGTISLTLFRTENGVRKYYALTCCHVLMDLELTHGIKEIKNGKNIVGSADSICPGNDTGQPGIILGKLTEGKLNEFTDSALVQLDNPDGISASIYRLGNITGTRTVDSGDIDNMTVSFCGAYSGVVENVRVRGYGISKQGDYPAAVSPQYINELIQLDKCSEEGDSGAAVLDSDRKVIGIIVGSNSTSTFVIPIQSIKSEHNQFQILYH